MSAKVRKKAYGLTDRERQAVLDYMKSPHRIAGRKLKASQIYDGLRSRRKLERATRQDQIRNMLVKSPRARENGIFFEKNAQGTYVFWYEPQSDQSRMLAQELVVHSPVLNFPESEGTTDDVPLQMGLFD